MPRDRQYAGYLFILPNLVGFLIFTLGPMLACLAIAFCRWPITRGPKFTGLDNFAALLRDERFWKYAYNTVFLMLGIPISMLGSLILAVLLHRRIAGVSIFRTIFYLPTVTAGVAIFILWKWLLDADTGPVNRVLEWFGLAGPRWLLDPLWAKPALILVSFWMTVGGTNMILYLAALSSINPELYEVAELDGCGAWRKFWNITWPLVSPTTFLITIMSIIGGLQGNFDTVFVMTGGGPGGSTTVLSYYIWEKGFETYQMGYAAAIAVFMFVVIFILTLLNWRFGGRVVHY